MKLLLSSIRVAVASSAICVVGYGALILAIGQTLTPETANGSLLRSPDGEIVGSRQVAQSFSRVDYFWPRLSAVDYDGAGAGGSNLAPTNQALAERAAPVLRRLGATAEHPVPADLVTASGSGLDPHTTLEGALYQASRVAEARGLAAEAVREIVAGEAFSSAGPFTEGRIVNVLELNLALDALSAREGAR